MGYGDDIMATAHARALKAEPPRARVVVGDGCVEHWSPVFEGNPHLSRLADVEPGDEIVWLDSYPGHRPYIDPVRSDLDYRIHYREYRATPGDLYLQRSDLAHVDRCLDGCLSPGVPRVLIEPHVDFGQPKDWGFERWQGVVDAMASCVSFVQPLHGPTPALRGVLAVPSGSFLQGCAILDRCDAYVGPEGGLHHAAAALGKPAVVVFGGRIPPRITGYDLHVNLYVEEPGSPCGMIADCEHCARCLALITVEQVCDGVCALLPINPPW